MVWQKINRSLEKKKIRKGSAGSMAAREEGGSRNGNQRRVKGKEKL